MSARDKVDKIHDLYYIIGEAHATPLPNFVFTPDYFQQVEVSGVAFIAVLLRAYDLGRFRHRNSIGYGRFAITDEAIAEIWGHSTTRAVREARKRVLNRIAQVRDYGHWLPKLVMGALFGEHSVESVVHARRQNGRPLYLRDFSGVFVDLELSEKRGDLMTDLFFGRTSGQSHVAG